MTSILFSVITVSVILLHNYCILFVAGSVYYVKPSVHNPCLEESSCLTLLQFAANAQDYLDSNVSLIFLPGYHSLDSRLSVHNISELSMHSNSTLSPSPIIFCQEQASINFSSIDVVYISHLKFVGCRSHRVTNIVNFFAWRCGLCKPYRISVIFFTCKHKESQ